MKNALLAAVLFLLSAAAAQPAGSHRIGRITFQRVPITYVSAARPVMAPLAHAMFCARRPAECRPSNAPAVVTLTPWSDQQLRFVNMSVNHAITPMPDRKDNGLGDSWNTGVAEGDCDDYALTKRERLIALGWSPRALRVAVARTRDGAGHAVLMVKTTRGDLVLDNRTDVIRDWRRTDLVWLMIQSGDNPRRWYAF